MSCFSKISALLNHPKHGRNISAYQSFRTSNDASSIHRKGRREIDLAKNSTNKMKNKPNHQNEPKSQNKLKITRAFADKQISPTVTN